MARQANCWLQCSTNIRLIPLGRRFSPLIFDTIFHLQGSITGTLFFARTFLEPQGTTPRAMVKPPTSGRPGRHGYVPTLLRGSRKISWTARRMKDFFMCLTSFGDFLLPKSPQKDFALWAVEGVNQSNGIGFLAIGLSG